METLSDLLSGFSVALDPANLFYVVIGVIIGTAIGVLPGLGPTATIALLLPLTYVMPAESAIIMLAGIYYGAFYGGTITSVLLQLPGEAASVVTMFDGYPMAQKGRAGPALGIAAIGSFIGAIVAVIGLAGFAPILASYAVQFGPPEYAALTALGLLLITYLGSGSTAKSLVMGGVGLLLATIGLDPIMGTPRFTFGILELRDGIEFVAIAMGVFGVGEVLYNLEQADVMTKPRSIVGRIWPSMADWRSSRGAIARGSLLGFFIGIFPGGSGTISSLASYGLEKRRAKEPERFGKGAIEGVAGPESANNAAATAGFIPLLTLGIPSNGVLALLFGALLIQGITPGPLLIDEHPSVFWGVIASMLVGNLVLLILNIPMVGVFIQLLRLRVGVLASLAMIVTMVGVFSVNNNIFDMWMVVIFGVLGYLMRKTGFPPGPLVLAFVLGPILERAFRQSLLISGGDLSIFVTRPASGTLLGVAGLLVVIALMQARKGRSPAKVVGDEEF